jgi:protein-S-isoprenylcysteine O-methyltransferase Ste14
MNLILFITAIALELIYIYLFLLTIRLPQFRFWPPPSVWSWQFFAAWLMASVVAFNFLLLGAGDFDSSFLPEFSYRWPVSMLFFSVGTLIGTWSFAAAGLQTTLGLGRHLVVRGPYRFTRNPQYIGDSLNIIGFMILTNSWMVWIIGLLGLALNGLAPLTEEPWLEERFGDSYREYQRSVRRF